MQQIKESENKQKRIEENKIEESARVPEYFVKRRPDIQKCLLEPIGNKHFVVASNVDSDFKN